NEIHPEQPHGPEGLLAVDGLVADRDAVLVDTVLETPEPVRLRADERGGLGDVGDLEILTAHPAVAISSARLPDDALALARRSVAVLREQRRAGPRRGRERHERIAAHTRCSPTPAGLSSSLTLWRASEMIPRSQCLPAS